MAYSAGGTVQMSESTAKMPYRLLGNTGLAVSVLSYGTWATYGAKDDLMGVEGVAVCKTCFRIARDAGVNLFDNAETYGVPVGAAESIMGSAIKELQAEDPVLWRRSDLVLTTKIFWGGDGVNEVGLSTKHLREGLTASLQRLQLEYVDLVFCHRPDPYTPTETVVRGMSQLVRSGQATAWGARSLLTASPQNPRSSLIRCCLLRFSTAHLTSPHLGLAAGTSEWSAAQLVEACWIAKTMGLEPPP